MIYFRQSHNIGLSILHYHSHQSSYLLNRSHSHIFTTGITLHLAIFSYNFMNFDVYSVTCIFYYLGEILTSGVNYFPL